MIYFDLDGVLRNLCIACLGHEADEWYETNDDGDNVIEIVNKNKSVLFWARQTEYFDYVNDNLDNVTILTNQLESWKQDTEMWLFCNFDIPYKVIYTKCSDEKLTFLKDDDILFEDYPFMRSYKNVALIDRKYNRCTKVPLRVHNINEFKKVIDKYV